LIFLRRIDIFRKRKKVRDNCPKTAQKAKEASFSSLGAMDTAQGHKSDSHMNRQRIKIDLLIHDLKVPLAVIDAGITSLLRRQEKYGPLSEGQEKVLLRALRNTKITQTLVNDALELARSREGIINLVNLKLSSLVEQALVEIFDLTNCDTADRIKTGTKLGRFREALEEKGILLFIDEDLWCQEVCLDEVKIKQILRNLLNNALKYRKSRVELEVLRNDSDIIFSVKDDGEGIPSMYHKKIFESYFQMDATDICSVRGHGLGLAGVTVLVEDIGGKLSLESDEGKGARFLVQVPLTPTK
jgi:two-component system OmpR family sensor kinase